MTTFTSLELVAAVMSQRQREASEQARGRALRLALACCSTAASGLRRLLPRRHAPAC